MECRQRISDGDVFWGIRCQVGNDTLDRIYERIEDAKYPDDSEKVKYEMGKCRPSGLCISGKCSYIGCHGGSYILSHHQGDTQVQVEHAART